MVGTFRNYWLAAGFLTAIVLVALALNLFLAIILGAVLGFAGVVLFKGSRWRSGALLVSALAVSVALLDAFAGLFLPAPMGAGLVRTTVPAWWPPPDPILGFRPKPDTEVVATATFEGQLVYRQVYHFDSTAARVTPPAPPDADTFLFMGDSFTFGQGLADDEALASQFAKVRDLKVHAVNLGVPGYGPNHVLRAFEAGLLDRYADKHVKAVILWIIPAHLARVTGDGSWLGSSPRYVLEGDKPHYTGTFDQYRIRNPLAGLKFLLGEQFAFVDAIGKRQRQQEQSELLVAIIARLQVLAREKFGVPLVIVYSWPDERSKPGHGDSTIEQPVLVGVLKRIRALGAPMISVDVLTNNMDTSRILIPHDGHPTAFTNELVTRELNRLLHGP